MKLRPQVCVIDEDPYVQKGWARSLKMDAELHYFKDHLEMFKRASVDKDLIASFHCIIIGRYFKHLNLDIIGSAIPETLKSANAGPIFLNWQGYITKDELNKKFDGKLFHKYGVRWQTLRLRIQKLEKRHQISKYGPLETLVKPRIVKTKMPSSSRPERCSALLRVMAKNASGRHREKIEFYASHDPSTGIQLLEAIYNRLVTDKNTPSTCPSRYINSSPVIAKRILHEALFS